METNVYVLLSGREIVGVFSSLPNALKQRSIDGMAKRKTPIDYKIAKYELNIPGESSMIPSAQK